MPDVCGERWDPDDRTCAADCAECGNGLCDPGEGPRRCAVDCCGACGDGTCKGGECDEGLVNCPEDCESIACGDRVCDPGENPASCPEDCERYACGNGACEPGEGPDECPEDCASACGDCSCEGGEAYDSCPIDCGYCGDGYCVDDCPYILENIYTCPLDCCLGGECTCRPACSERECGHDGCGGECGRCPAGHACSNGTCVLSCQSGLTDCQGVCVDLQRDRDHCGECGRSCAAGLVCDVGTCVATCPVGLAVCDETCVDLTRNPDHCGACGQGCELPEVEVAYCWDSECAIGVCLAGFGDCDGEVDNGCETVLDSIANCGRCGSPCELPHAAAACVYGTCRPETCDEGWADCDDVVANGCEADLSSIRTCAGCDSSCDPLAEVCENGACAQLPHPLPLDIRWMPVGDGDDRESFPPGCDDVDVLCNKSSFDFPWPPDTGQLLCYDEWTAIACPGTAGADDCADTNCCGQDAQYGWDVTSPSWSNERFAVTTEEGDALYEDRWTGLDWQASTTVAASYEDAVAICAQTYGGRTDWRVPNLYELLSVTSFDNERPTHWVLDDHIQGQFWTSSASAQEMDGDFPIHFVVQLHHSPTHILRENINQAGTRVRCVGSTASDMPAQRFFSDNPHPPNVVFDSYSGLLWRQADLAPVTWRTAHALCEELSFAGIEDWRVPNLVELFSLIDATRWLPCIDPTVFPQFGYFTDLWIWSSTTSQSVESAWVINFYNSLVVDTGKFNRNMVWCVALGP